MRHASNYLYKSVHSQQRQSKPPHVHNIGGQNGKTHTWEHYYSATDKHEGTLTKAKHTDPSDKCPEQANPDRKQVGGWGMDRVSADGDKVSFWRHVTCKD